MALKAATSSVDVRAARLRWKDIRVGDVYSFRRTVTAKDVAAFAELTGDNNPLHVTGGVAHGLLVGSFFSRLIGMLCPGRHSLYISQMFNWRRPVRCGVEVEVRGVVAAKHKSVRLIRMRTQVLADGQVAVDGEARVKVLTD